MSLQLLHKMCLDFGSALQQKWDWIEPKFIIYETE